jgi:class 3 adenylate cyclase
VVRHRAQDLPAEGPIERVGGAARLGVEDQEPSPVGPGTSLGGDHQGTTQAEAPSRSMDEDLADLGAVRGVLVARPDEERGADDLGAVQIPSDERRRRSVDDVRDPCRPPRSRLFVADVGQEVDGGTARDGIADQRGEAGDGRHVAVGIERLDPDPGAQNVRAGAVDHARIVPRSRIDRSWRGVTISAMNEAAATTDPAAPDPVQVGRAAVARHDWVTAFDALTTAERGAALSGEDLEALALSAFFVARSAESLDIRERAFKAHEAAGNTERAAFLAIDIARDYGYQGRGAIATAWLHRAERLIGPVGVTYPHGYVALGRSEAARAVGDIDAAVVLAERAVEIGRTAGHPDLLASALSHLGSLRIATGAAADGLLMMEEASIAAVNGELSPFTTGVTACQMISACRDLTDYRRASEWIEATDKYCTNQSLSGFPGVCRIHRAEVSAVSGAWDRAELELERATGELEAYGATPPQADGFYAMGDIRRLRGDFAGAELALREAHSRGRTPQPALALIRLAEGKTKAAAAAINAALADQTWDRWARSRLLPAKIEIALAAGDPAAARAALDELAGIVEGYPSPALEAGRKAAAGRVLQAEGDAAAAVGSLRSAIQLWREVGAPYEVARSREVLARALRELDDEDGADLELQAALDDYRRLGARVNAEALEREQRAIDDRRSGPVQARMTFMFTDIVGSTNLAEALGDHAWERLLRWHDDTLRGLVRSGGGDIVNSTGDGFFAAFASAAAGVACAVAIQRALRDHRAATGFAIAVRIGLHTADANRREDDYSGMGVHVAARVAALAVGGEIVVTAETLAEAGEQVAGELRDVVIKGVSAGARVATVTWS